MLSNKKNNSDIVPQNDGFVTPQDYFSGRGTVTSLTDENLEKYEEILDQQLKEEQYGLRGVAKFPTEIFPKPIQEFIKTQARALPVPEDFVGVGVLAVISATIGNTTVIDIKNSWKGEGCNLWLGIIGDPSVRKTPALKAPMSPLMKLEKHLHNEFLSLKQQFKQNNEQYKLELDTWKADYKKGKATIEDMPEEPEKPDLQRIVVIKNTMEGLFKVLSKNPNGVIRFNDEIKALFTELNKYRNGDDRQTLLELFSRNRVTVDLKSTDEPEVIEEPFVTILGGTQPETIEPIIKDGAGDGLSARFLFVYPETKISEWTDDDVSENVLEDYEKIIIDLYWSRPKEQKTLNLSLDAYELFKLVANKLRSEMNSSEFPYELLAPYGKLDGYLARFILLLHVVAYSCGETQHQTIVDQSTVEKAYKLLEYFKSHMKKIYNRTGVNIQDKNCVKLVEHTRKKGIKTDFGYELTFRDIQRSNIFGKGKTTHDAVFEAVNHLKINELGTYQMKETRNGKMQYKFILFQ